VELSNIQAFSCSSLTKQPAAAAAAGVALQHAGQAPHLKRILELCRDGAAATIICNQRARDHAGLICYAFFTRNSRVSAMAALRCPQKVVLLPVV